MSTRPVIRGPIQDEGCFVQVRVGSHEFIDDPRLEHVEVRALIDTGAHSSTVSLRVVKALGLASRGKVGVTSAHSRGQPVETDYYGVAIVFENDAAVLSPATGADFGDRRDLDVIIGRDVLAFGRFVYRGRHQEWILDFDS